MASGGLFHEEVEGGVAVGAVIDATLAEEEDDGVYAVVVGLATAALVAVEKKERRGDRMGQHLLPQCADVFTVGRSGAMVDARHIAQNLDTGLLLLFLC